MIIYLLAICNDEAWFFSVVLTCSNYRDDSMKHDYTSMKNLEKPKHGFWGVLASKARTRSIIDDEDDGPQQYQTPERRRQQMILASHYQKVSMAMAAKAKLLLRELKTVKADLAFAKERCAHLEQENRILRETNGDGDYQEDDDLSISPSLELLRRLPFSRRTSVTRSSFLRI
ncbi:hypothetical protein L2E82_18581 [Cichorium intybus]|uniref:Uncharacterized protein n=1 Tax=Cichorium intybus TaxID=13427 RepID=A0ACB9FB25_CICIN|nr:hypothetical protein L2E82_18581 [Cichorium intybus]